MTTKTGRLLERLPVGVQRLVPVELRSDLRDRFGTWVPGDIGYVPTPPPVQPGERTSSNARWPGSGSHRGFDSNALATRSA